jgi:fucose permease
LNRGTLASLLIAYFAFITIGIPDGALNITWTYMQPTFNVELGALGVLLGAAMGGRLVASFAAGRLIARIGVQRLLILGAGLLTLGGLGFVIAPTWETLLLAALVLWLGSGSLDAGLNTFVSANYSIGRLNWLHAAFGIGATAGPALATVIITQLNAEWRWVYVVLLIPGALAVLLFAFTRGGWAMPNQETIATEHQTSAGIAETLRSPMVWLSLGLFFAYGGAELGTGQLANTLFVDGRQIDQETAGFWISLYWALFTVGRLIMGVIADKVPVHALLRISMIGVVIGAALLWFNPTPNVGFLGLALMGFANAPLFAALTAETPRRVGARLASNTIGFQVGMAGLGGAVVPGLAAGVAAQAGLNVIAPIIFGVSALVLVFYEVIVWREGVAERTAGAARAAGD